MPTRRPPSSCSPRRGDRVWAGAVRPADRRRPARRARHLGHGLARSGSCSRPGWRASSAGRPSTPAPVDVGDGRRLQPHRDQRGHAGRPGRSTARAGDRAGRRGALAVRPVLATAPATQQVYRYVHPARSGAGRRWCSTGSPRNTFGEVAFWDGAAWLEAEDADDAIPVPADGRPRRHRARAGAGGHVRRRRSQRHPHAAGGTVSDDLAPAVVTTALTKRYGTLTAVDAMDLVVPRGSIFGLIGPNGAGKTTTFAMFATLLAPTSGSLQVLGVDPASQPRDVRRRLGLHARRARRVRQPARRRVPPVLRRQLRHRPRTSGPA